MTYTVNKGKSKVGHSRRLLINPKSNGDSSKKCQEYYFEEVRSLRPVPGFSLGTLVTVWLSSTYISSSTFTPDISDILRSQLPFDRNFT